MTGQLRRGRGWDVGPGALGVPSVFGGGARSGPRGCGGLPGHAPMGLGRGVLLVSSRCSWDHGAHIPGQAGWGGGLEGVGVG